MTTTKMNKEPLYNSPQMDELFSDFDPAEAARVENKMLLAAKIDDAIKSNGWSKKEFAVNMGKKPSEISKWLSGTHNFTTDTLFDISKVLGINLINLEEQKPQPQLEPTQANYYQITITSKSRSPAIPLFGAGIWGTTPIVEKRKSIHSKMGRISLVKNPKTQYANA